jgi:SAM-dependent methyltransferase
VLVRSAGNHAEVVAQDAGYTQIKLPSTEIRKIHSSAWASVGEVGNEEHRLVTIGKAGRNRWLGKRPVVRGSVMNPVDHPHGGGEGKSPRGMRRQKTKWGKPAGKGQKTRTPKKYSNTHLLLHAERSASGDNGNISYRLDTSGRKVACCVCGVAKTTCRLNANVAVLHESHGTIQNMLLPLPVHSRLAQGRARYAARALAKYFSAGERVLDFGAGDMRIAQLLEAECGVQITGSDVQDLRALEAQRLPFVPLSEGPLPFADDSFDVALCCFVLHHTHSHENLLRELIRVAPRIVLVEDVYTSMLSKKVLCLHDRIGNYADSPSIPTPCTFRTDQEWRTLFGSLGLSVREIESWKPALKVVPFTHITYVLERSDLLEGVISPLKQA